MDLVVVDLEAPLFVLGGATGKLEAAAPEVELFPFPPEVESVIEDGTVSLTLEMQVSYPEELDDF